MGLTAMSWAAHMGMLAVAGTPRAFMGFKYTSLIFTLLAMGELINNKLPKTGSRKEPQQFIARILYGGLVGATVGAPSGSIVFGIIADAIGAVAGTYRGAAARGFLASAYLARTCRQHCCTAQKRTETESQRCKPRARTTVSARDGFRFKTKYANGSLHAIPRSSEGLHGC